MSFRSAVNFQQYTNPSLEYIKTRFNEYLSKFFTPEMKSTDIIIDMVNYCSNQMVNRNIIQQYDIEIVKTIWKNYKTDVNNSAYKGQFMYQSFMSMECPIFFANFVSKLRDEYYMGYTENSALSLNTTTNSFVDAFFKFVRKLDKNSIENMLNKCWNENIYKTGRLIFQTRDIRGGKGERELFCRAMAWMCDNHVEYFNVLFPLFLEYGRGDDLYRTLSYVDKTNLDNVLNMVNKHVFIQLRADIMSMEQGKPISLMAKWFPSENSHFDKKLKFYSKFCATNKLQYRTLRKYFLVPLRSYLNIVEQILSSRSFDKLTKEYLSHVPTQAMRKLKKAFERHSPEWINYIASLKRGDKNVKVNVKAGFPHEIIHEYLNNLSYNGYNGTEDSLVEQQWKQKLIDIRESFGGENFLRNSIALCDTSGSMYGTPIEVSIAMGLIISRFTNDAFKDTLITFESEPHFIQVPNTEVVGLSKTLSFMLDSNKFSWGGSTNFSKVFTVLLNRLQNYTYPINHDRYPGWNGVQREDMPERLFIFSDMQFDSADDGNYHTNFESIKKKFTDAGYKMPQLIFWNLRANTNDFPVKSIENNVVLLSGYSPTLIKSILNGKDELNPTVIVDNILNDKRYDLVESLMRRV